jgi:hypothetical protein
MSSARDNQKHENNSGIDTDRDTGLMLSYLLNGIASRAEQLAVEADNSSTDYTLKSASVLHRQQGGSR